MRKIAGLLLSAGLSSRMTQFKPLIKYDNNTFITGILRKLINVCECVYIVTGYKANLVVEEVQKSFKDNLNQLFFVFNKNFADGMFSSIYCGVKEIHNYEWFLCHYVDQPCLPIDFYTGLCNEIGNNFDWIQPIFNKKKGHPIIFNYLVAQKIISSDQNSSLKEISNSVKKKYWNCNYQHTLIDFNTYEDLKNIIN
jgi:molybdenum cofactor cytidylyltransferase